MLGDSVETGQGHNGRKAVKTFIMGSGRGMNVLLTEIVLWSASILPQEGFMLVLSPKLYKVKLRRSHESYSPLRKRGDEDRSSGLGSGYYEE